MSASHERDAADAPPESAAASVTNYDAAPVADSVDGSRESPESPESPEAAADPTLAATVAAAARRAGLGPAAEGDMPDGKALLATMGGARGIAETIVPGLLFLVGFTITGSLPVALAVSVGVAVVFTIARVATRTPLTQAVAGLIGVGASAALALLTNRPEDNFVIGLYTNAAYGIALLVSVLVGWPLIGLFIGYLMGVGTRWRAERRKFRAMQVLTLIWVGMFGLRLAVQLPLYLAGNVEWLAATRLLMGIPLYAPLLLLSWLVARSVFADQKSADQKRADQKGAALPPQGRPGPDQVKENGTR